MGALISAIAVMNCFVNICTIFCCYGIYQVLLWVWLLYTGSVLYSDILLTIYALLSFAIIYVTFTFAISDTVDAFVSTVHEFVCIVRFSLFCVAAALLVKLNVIKRSVDSVHPSFMFVTVILFCCGMSKLMIWLSELHLFLLFVLLTLFGLCISSAVSKWIESHFSADGTLLMVFLKELKCFFFSFLICSIIINVSNPSYGTKPYAEGQGDMKIRIKTDALRPSETDTCPTFDGNEARAIIDVLERDSTSLLHARHLVSHPVSAAIQSHLDNPDPPKALVLSFHGPTGVGKNFVSDIIADSLFQGGRRNKFVHTIIGPHHFPHNIDQGAYSAHLHKWISCNVSSCPRSLFIFDEVDKFPPGLIDSVKGYLDHYRDIDGVVYRKAIFILISNTGGDALKRYAYDHRQRPRESLTLKELEHVMFAAANAEDGGLKKGQLLDKHLVNVFVPFLPMEKVHVRLCIEDDLRRKAHPITEDLVEDVLKEMTFFPPDWLADDGVQFSETGCKRVTDKVDLITYERKLRRTEL